MKPISKSRGNGLSPAEQFYLLAAQKAGSTTFAVQLSEFNYLLERGQKRTPARFAANCFSDLCNVILTHHVDISITPKMTKAEHRKEKEKLWWFSRLYKRY